MSLEPLMEVEVSALYVFPRSVIQNRGSRSLGELLQVVPGFLFQVDLRL